MQLEALKTSTIMHTRLSCRAASRKRRGPKSRLHTADLKFSPENPRSVRISTVPTDEADVKSRRMVRRSISDAVSSLSNTVVTSERNEAGVECLIASTKKILFSFRCRLSGSLPETPIIARRPVDSLFETGSAGLGRRLVMNSSSGLSISSSSCTSRANHGSVKTKGRPL